MISVAAVKTFTKVYVKLTVVIVNIKELRIYHF